MQFGSYLARTVVTLTIPQGYTLSIAGTFGVASHRYGSPFVAEAWGFVVGAIVAFVLMSAFAGHRLRGPIVEVPSGFRATFNVVPIGSVLLGSAAAYAIPWATIGYAVSGFVAVVAYVLLVSLFYAVAAGLAGSPSGE
ncbi:MAG: hypothetical protein ACREQM_10525 [Candidatus Dormibacteraceae bacterium]